jgi:filamentous hemagglutinin family protein
LWLLASNPTAAEIVPDTTLPINSTVTAQGNIRLIEAGTRRGDNLFHSFREFSFSVLTSDTTGDTAFFNNDSTVKNIITRVTGGSISNIDGIIRANSTANLFLINPNGIIFGQNASLDIGGSFVASTANSVRFADGTEFSATAPQASPLLTVSVPLGLQFGSNPGEIVNQSQASPNGTVNSIGSPVGLQVPSGKTLALVGGNVSLAGGNLTAAGGRIELGSLAGGGFVELREIDTGYALGYTNVQNFGDIQLYQGALVDASGEGGGAIQLQGRNITLTDNSIIFAITFGSKTGENLVINAAESVKVSGGSNILTVAEGEGRAGDVLVRALDSIELLGTTSDGSPSGVGSQVCVLSSDCQSVTGNGGNLTIETARLLIQDGAAVDASTFGTGRAGNVLVKASESIELAGGQPDGQVASGIFAQVGEGATGNGGNLTIETERLVALGGAQIATAARSGGQGGTLTINASDSILLSGTAPIADAKSSSGLFISAEPGSTRNGGELNLTTGLLTVEKGAKISADTLSTAQAGNVTLNVRQLIIRDGGRIGAGSFAEGPGGILTVNATESVDVTGTGTIGSNSVPSNLFTQANSSGKAGDLIITTRRLHVQDGAQVSVSGQGSGPAGNLRITASTIRLNRGRLRAETQAGSGANINLKNLDLLLMRHQSQISAQAFNDANGGDITTNGENGFIVAVPKEDSDIIANAFRGNGGNIQITAQGIYGLEYRPQLTPLSDINASSQFGVNGTVQINTPGVDPSRGLGELPSNLVDATGLIDRHCTPRGGSAQRSSFTITGRGGLPPGPNDILQNESVITNWVTADPHTNPRPRNDTSPNPHRSATRQTPALIEAQGWVYGPNGEVILTAQAPHVTPHSPTLTPPTCSNR